MLKVSFDFVEKIITIFRVVFYVKKIMSVYYLGSDSNYLKRILAWANSEKIKISDALMKTPETGAKIIVLGFSALKEYREIFSYRDDLKPFLLVDQIDVWPEKGFSMPIIWADADISFQIKKASKYNIEWLSSFNDIDIKNLVTLPIFTKNTYNAINGFVRYVQNISASERITMVVLFPVGNYGVVVSSTDNFAFKNYVLFLDSYPELKELIQKKSVVRYSRESLLAKGVQLSQNEDFTELTALPLKNKSEEIVAALIIKRKSSAIFDEDMVFIAQKVFANFLGSIFLFEKGGLNVGGCPFLTNTKHGDFCWAVFNVFPVGVMIVDGQGIIEFVNGKLEELLSLEKEAILNKNASNIFGLSAVEITQSLPYYHFYTLLKKELVWKKFRLSEEKFCYFIEESDKNATVKLEKEIEKLRGFINQGDGLICFDIIGTIKIINSVAESKLNRKASETEDISNISLLLKDVDVISNLYDLVRQSKVQTGVVKLPINLELVSSLSPERELKKKERAILASVAYCFETELFVATISKNRKKSLPLSFNTDSSKYYEEILQKLAGAISHNFNQSFSVMGMYLSILKERIGDPKLVGYIDKIENEVAKVVELSKNIKEIDIAHSEKYVGSTDILSIMKERKQ